VLAAEAASFTGYQDTFVELGRRAAELPAPADVQDRLATAMLIGMGESLSGDWARGAARLRSAIEEGLSADEPEALLRIGRAAFALGDDAAAWAAHSRAAEMIRRSGAAGLLPTALDRLAYADLLAGRLADALVAGTESMQLARDTGQDAAHHLNGLAVVHAWRGDAEACRDLAEQARVLAGPRPVALLTSVGTWAMGLLELGLGRPAEALTHLEPIFDGHRPFHPAVRLWAAADLVEAAVRAGRPDLAGPVAEQFGAWAQRIELPWAAAVAGRCRALLDPGPDALDGFAAALDLHADGNRPLERARTELAYGEALRRARQRTASRTHLRAAMATFTQHGATPWAERARAELRATGETVHRPGPLHRDRLTAQELQISRLVAAGASNPEIAAQLFLSRRTVEYHLRKVFTKLGVTSRTELAGHDLDR
jgi:DNA-binding CsgD family transcriptional regulator